MAPAVKVKAEQGREERRQQILAAALELFAERGLHDTSVSRIAARAGVSQGTVYWYFDSKEQLFEAAFMDRLEAVLAPFFEVVGDAGRSPAARLLAAAEGSLDLFAENPELAFLLLQIMATRGVAKLLAYDIEDYYRRFSEVMTPLFAELGDPDPPATTQLHMGLLDGLMLQRAILPDMANREALLTQIAVKFNLREDA